MANIRTQVDAALYALVSAFNLLHDEVTSVESLDGYHRDQTVTVGGDFKSPTFTTLKVVSAVGSTQDGYSTLANEICGVLHKHFQDDSAHLIVDTVNDGYLDGYYLISGSPIQPEPGFEFLPIGSESLSDLMNAANALKVAFNAHLSQSGVHVSNDSGNVVGTANATDLASSGALVSALKSAVNLHMWGTGSGPNALPRIRLK